ncbi:MAG: type 4a pilus biogenesis protein PilO [Planctomycetota bacterium]
MRLTEKQQFVVVIVVFAVAILGEGLFAYSCLRKRTELKETRIKLDQEEAEAQAKIAMIPKLRKESEELAQIIEDYAEILPTEAEVSLDAFLEDIEQFIQDTSLVIVNGAPVEKKFVAKKKGAPEAARVNFEQHKYRFQLEGTYLDFVRFVNRVENHTRFLEIVEMKIAPTGKTGRGEGGEEIRLAENSRKTIELVISTYTYARPVVSATPESGTPRK